MPRKILPTTHPTSLLLMLHIILLLAGTMNALPTVPRAHMRRQDGNITEPMIVETSRTSNTSIGPMNETCSVSLTPIILEDGQEAVELVKNCTVSLSGSDGASSNLTTTTSSLDPSSSSTLSLPSALLPSATTTLSSAPSYSEPPPAATTTSPADNGVAPGTPITDPISPTALAAPPTETGTTNGSPDLVLSDIPATGTAAGALESPTGTATYSTSIQGKKLSVLPIGLGVFAGISVIALIIVGLVTYERTKYRKAFRERKRAEESLDFGNRGPID